MKIKAATLLTKVKHVTLFAITYIDRNGEERRWHLVSRNKEPKCISGDLKRVDASIIVPYHKQADKLVVIKEFRIPLGEYHYGFPAGLIDPGEDLETTTARELKEETGLTLEKIYRKSPAIFSSPGITDETVAMVFVEVSGSISNIYNNASEEIEARLLGRQQVGELLQRQDIYLGSRAWLVMDAFVNFGVPYLTASQP